MNAPPPGDSASRILQLLKTRGELDAQALAAELGISSMGARQQLLRLEKDGLVESFNRSGTVGRPARVWQLAPLAWSRFPDRHEELSVQLIAAVREEFGAAGLERLVVRRERESEQRYREALAGSRSLRERLERLAEIRSREGYMASVHTEARGRYLLVEDHCPVCAAARACQGFCRAELEVFRRVLGATVERTEYLLEGARRCAYRVSAPHSG